MFEPGDKVVQIKKASSLFFNFNPTTYPVLTVKSSSADIVTFEENPKPTCDPARFRKVCNLVDTNPKDAIGRNKPSMSAVPATVLLELGAAFTEGSCKYGAFNFRVADVSARVYYDAALRHLFSYFEGEDIDPDSGLPHVTKAMACLVVLRDAQMNGRIVDDRPPKAKEGWQARIQDQVNFILNKYPDAKEANTHEQTSQ